MLMTSSTTGGLGANSSATSLTSRLKKEELFRIQKNTLPDNHHMGQPPIGELPTISIVIPTYNCAALLPRTLASLTKQDYPPQLIEKILVDGGSTDNTRQLAQQHGFRIVENPARSNLYGLPLGFTAATGKLILQLDDDNVLNRPDWLQKMVEPFSDPAIVAAEPLFYTTAPDSNIITRYISLLGADDPLIVYAGYHDRFSQLTNSWTGVPHTAEDRGNYLSITFSDINRLPTLACNAFLCRREALLEVSQTPWLHIDGAARLLKTPHRKWAKVKVGIINHHAPGIIAFFIKKSRRLKTRSREAAHFEYRYPTSRAQIAGIILRSGAIVPLILDAARGYRRRPDAAWLLHPVLTLGTIGTYGWTYFQLKISKTNQPALLSISSQK